ncbi:ribonucleotide reductase [Mycena vitilis]|nr:ribonucleotide reductase [Mycena vitilis]
MLVRKRDGRKELFNLNKLEKRLETTTFGVNQKHVDILRIALDVQEKMGPGITTGDIEELAIQSALSSAHLNGAYCWIAGRLEINKMRRVLHPQFSATLRGFRTETGEYTLSRPFLDVVEEHHEALDQAVVHGRDFDHTYHAIRDIQYRSLARDGDSVLERIQHMFMRTAVAIHMNDIPNVLATYDLMSSRHIVHDIFVTRNAGLIAKPLSSISTLALLDMDVHGVFDALGQCAFVARDGGRVAICATAVPCDGRNPFCNHTKRDMGTYSLLKLLEGALSFTRRPGDSRPNLANVSIETWHIDIRSVLEFVNMHQEGLCEQKSITIALSVPDIFMARVEASGPWTLFCPEDVPDLMNGGLRRNEFEDAYARYEASNLACTKIQARDLWNAILKTIVATGGPSILFKDSINGKSNVTGISPRFHADPGTGAIDMVATPRLSGHDHASVTLPLFVTAAMTFDFGKLRKCTSDLVINMNKILDARFAAPSEDCNRNFRVIAIGINGFADVLAALRLPYASPEAASLNGRIMETMYYAGMDASCHLARSDGPYEAFQESPLAKGMFQFDLWNATPSNSFDWDNLRSRVKRYGVRNAAILAIAPGSCPESVTGYTASVDPIMSNLDGDVVCPWLVKELDALGLWTEDMRRNIVNGGGTIQHIDSIPEDVKEIYRTAWEIDSETLVRMSLHRGPFVCHSQSLSLYIENPQSEQLPRQGELLTRAWASGMKTGLHRLYSRSVDRSSKGTSSEQSESADGEMSFDDIIISGSPATSSH